MNAEIRTTGPVLTNQSEANRDRPFDFGTTTLPNPDKLPGGYDDKVKLLEMSDIQTVMDIADSNIRAEKPRIPYDNKNAALYAIFGNRSFEAAHNGTVADGAVKAYMVGIRNIRKARDTKMQNTSFWNEQIKKLREELNTREVPASWLMTTDGEIKPTDKEHDPDTNKKIGMGDFIDGLFLKSGEVIKNASGSAVLTTLGRTGFYGAVWRHDMNTIEAATKASRLARKHGAPENPASSVNTEDYGLRMAPVKLERHQVEIPTPDAPDVAQAPATIPIDDHKPTAVSKARGAVAISFVSPEQQQAPAASKSDAEEDDDEEEDETSTKK